MLLSDLEVLDLNSNNLTVLPIIKIKSFGTFIGYSHNPLKFPKMNEEEEAENIGLEELNEFNQIHVDLYHTAPTDIDLNITDTNTLY
jgi:hypothetical protein